MGTRRQTVLDNDATSAEWPTFHVPIGDVHFDPEKNSRRVKSTPEEIATLADDIKARKQLFPLIVFKRGDNGTVDGEANGGYLYEGVDGERRYHALKLLAEDDPDIQAFIRVLPSMDDAEAYTLSMKANDPTLRKEPSLIDLAGNIIQMKSQGKSGKEIAEEMHKSQGWVSNVQKLVDLRPAIQKRIVDRTIPWSLVRILPGLTEEEQDAAIADLDASTGGKASTIAQEHRKPKVKAAGKGKKGKKGKSGKSGKKPEERAGMSSKAAVKVFEKLSAEPVAGEDGKVARETKAEVNRRLLFGLIGKFLVGRLKQVALANKVLELL